MTNMMTFGNLEIRFDDRVLRPRPWTQAQSEWAAELAATVPDGPLLELCAGVGHLGLLLTSLTDRELVMIDADETACEFARANARAAGLESRVEVRHGPVDALLDPAERFALMLADPPWVPSRDTARYPEDPGFAIDGGPDGLSVARTCVEVTARHLYPGGAAVLQLGDEGQASRLDDELAARSGDGLRVVEVRTVPGANGVLVKLAGG